MSDVITAKPSSSSDKSPSDAVIVTRHSAQSVDGSYKCLMQLTLNAPTSINALSLDMVRIIHPLLEAWRDDDSVACILLDGMGDKGFCAGGDIRSLYAGMTDPEQAGYCEQFFTEEYRLDYLIHRYEKPVICWGSGIVIGGGLGLMAGASHRVVTETSRISMPEVSIGLFPDVGGTWFLNHMPGRWGLFFALTASAMNGRDARVLGLADHYARAGDKSRLMRDLCQHQWHASAAEQHQAVNQILATLEADALALMPESKVLEHFDLINRAMSHGRLATTLVALGELGESADPWLQKIPQVLNHGSPLAMAVIEQQLRVGRHMSLAEVFRSELSLAVNLSEAGEFAEGIRALLIEKDQQPQWRCKTLAAVDAGLLQQLFGQRWEQTEHPLADLL